MSAPQNLPWPRIVVEGIVIVGSILMAFGIDALWEQRQEAQRVQIALANLQTSVEASLVEVDAERSRLELEQRRLLTFTQMDPASLEVLSPDTAAMLLMAVVRPVVNDLNSGVILRMLAGDDLVRLADPEFQSGVAEWGDGWQNLRQRHESLYQIEREMLVALGRVEATQIRPYDAGDLGPQALRFARQSPEVMALAMAKLSHWDVLSGGYAFFRGRGETLLDVIELQRQR